MQIFQNDIIWEVPLNRNHCGYNYIGPDKDRAVFILKVV